MLGPLSALLSSVTWALGSSQYSRFSRDHSAFAVNFSRALFALPLFTLMVFVASGGWQAGLHEFGTLGLRHLGWFSLSMISSYAFGDVLFLWSTRSLGVPGALAIASSYPVMTALLDVFVRGNPMRGVAILGLGITVAGVITVILNAPQPHRETPREAATAPGHLNRKAVGVALAFATALFWALNAYAVAQGAADVHPAVGNALRMLIGMVIIYGLGRVVLPGSPVVLPVALLRRFSWLFVFEAFGGSLFFMYGLAHSPLVLGTTLVSLAPVLAVPLAWLLRTEKPSVGRTLGVISVASGLYLMVATPS
jgi:drug/metabolite transporter (DMT)-like permease